MMHWASLSCESWTLNAARLPECKLHKINKNFSLGRALQFPFSLLLPRHQYHHPLK